MPEPLKLSLLFRFPHQTLYTFLLSSVHAPCPVHLSFLDLTTQILNLVTYTSHIARHYKNFPVISSFLGANVFLSTLVSNTLSLCPSLNATDHVSHPYKTNYSSVYFHVFTARRQMARENKRQSCFIYLYSTAFVTGRSIRHDCSGR
jgi:hypothetical protein